MSDYLHTFNAMRRDCGFWRALNWLLITVTAPPAAKARNKEMRRKWSAEDDAQMDGPSLNPDQMVGGYPDIPWASRPASEGSKDAITGLAERPPAVGSPEWRDNFMGGDFSHCG